MVRASRKKNQPPTKVGTTTKKYRANAILRHEQEKRLQVAMEGYRTGVYKSLRAAARDNHIKATSTLTRRYNGQTQPRDVAHARQHLIHRHVEEIAVEWTQYLGEMGRPFCKRTIGPLIQRLCGRKPSRIWVYRFIGRHSDLLQNRGRRLDPLRAQAFNKTAVSRACKQLDDFFLAQRVTADKTANMDEIGFQLCGQRSGSNTVYLFSSSDTSRYTIEADDLTLVTVLDSIFLDGTLKARPCFVVPGTLFDPSWGKDVEGNPLICTSDTGWTNEDIFQNWLETAFIPDTQQHGDPDAPILLTLDGHESHVKNKAAKYAREHNTHIFVGLPHATHRMQPCDVGAFGPLKTAWDIRTREILSERGTPIQLNEVVREYMKVRRSALTPEVIENAWCETGFSVEPDGTPRCSASVWSDRDFAPSISTSTKAQLPAGFPQIPSDVDTNESSSESGSDMEDDEEIGHEEPAMVSADADDGSHAEADRGIQAAQGPDLEAHGDEADDTAGVEEEEDGDDADDEAEDAADVGEVEDIDQPSSTASPSASAHNLPLPQAGDVILERIQAVRMRDDPPDSPSEPGSSDSDHVAFFRAKAKRSKERTRRAREERDIAQTYAILGGQRIEALQARLNAKTNPSRRNLTLSTGSRFTTADELVVEGDIRDENTRAKKQHKDDVQQKKQDAAAGYRWERVSKGKTGIVFETPSYKMNLAQLRQLAWCLGLDEKGQVASLKLRVKEHLEAHPELKETEQFSAMFTRKGRRQPAEVPPPEPNLAAMSEGPPPGLTPALPDHPSYPSHAVIPPSRPHLGEITNNASSPSPPNCTSTAAFHLSAPVPNFSRYHPYAHYNPHYHSNHPHAHPAHSNTFSDPSTSSTYPFPSSR